MRLTCHCLVVGDAVAIKARVARSAAEHVAHQRVIDALAGKPLCEIAFREPRKPPRGRDTANIGDGGYFGLLEQRDEAVDGMLEWPMVKRSKAGAARINSHIHL